MTKLKSIEKMGFWKALICTERFILVTTSVLAAGVITVGVFTRYVLGKDFFGQEEIVTVIAMWLYWIGGVYGSYEDSHIQADILNTYIKNEKALKVLRLFVLLVSIIVLGVLTMWSFDYIKWSLETEGKSVGLKIPLILSQIPLCIGFVMMVFYSVYHFIRTLMPQKAVAEEGRNE